MAGADAYERELLDAFDVAPKRLGRYLDAEDERDAAKRRPQNAKAPRVAGLLGGTGATGLEPATSGVTGRRSNQLSYAPRGRGLTVKQGWRDAAYEFVGGR